MALFGLFKSKKETVTESKKEETSKKHITNSEGELIPEEKVKTKYLCIYNADGSFDPKTLNKMYNIIKIDEKK